MSQVTRSPTLGFNRETLLTPLNYFQKLSINHPLSPLGRIDKRVIMVVLGIFTVLAALISVVKYIHAKNKISSSSNSHTHKNVDELMEEAFTDLESRFLQNPKLLTTQEAENLAYEARQRSLERLFKQVRHHFPLDPSKCKSEFELAYFLGDVSFTYSKNPDDLISPQSAEPFNLVVQAFDCFFKTLSDTPNFSFRLSEDHFTIPFFLTGMLKKEGLIAKYLNQYVNCVFIHLPPAGIIKQSSISNFLKNPPVLPLLFHVERNSSHEFDKKGVLQKCLESHIDSYPFILTQYSSTDKEVIFECIISNRYPEDQKQDQ